MSDLDFEIENVDKRYFALPYQNITLTEKKNVLLDSMFQSEDLNEFSDSLARLLDAPVLLLTPSYVVIACSRVHEITESVWLHAMDTGYYPDYVISHIVEHHREWDLTYEKRELFERSLPFTENGRLLCNMWHRGVLLGSIVTLLSGQTLDENDRELLLFARDLVEKILGLGKTGVIEKVTAQETLLVALLHGKDLDRETIYSQFLINNTDATGHYLLINVEFQSPGKPDDFLRSFSILFSQTTTLIYNNRLLIFFAQLTPIDISESLITTFEELLSKYNAFACISDEFEDLFHIREHYRKNVRIGKLAVVTSDTRRIIHYDEYKFFDMYLLAASSIGTLETDSFVYHKAYEIYKYDMKYGTKYIDTLWSYISTKESVNDAGKMMYVHRNTIVYRISRIKDLFQLDLSQVDNNFHLYYSCCILRFHEKMRRHGNSSWKDLHWDYDDELK